MIQSRKIERCFNIESPCCPGRLSGHRLLIIQLEMSVPELPRDPDHVPRVWAHPASASDNGWTGASVKSKLHSPLLDGKRGEVTRAVSILASIDQDTVTDTLGLEFNLECQSPQHVLWGLIRDKRLTREGWGRDVSDFFTRFTRPPDTACARGTCS